MALEDVTRWLQENVNNYDTRPELIRAGASHFGRTYGSVYDQLKPLEDAGGIVRLPGKIGDDTTSKSVSYANKIADKRNVMKVHGMPREQAMLKHDIPAKLSHALNLFLDSMESGFMYEENQVRHVCNVAKIEQEYWEDITSLPEFSRFTGLTETNQRLWGTEEDIAWGVANMTGFRRVL